MLDRQFDPAPGTISPSLLTFDKKRTVKSCSLEKIGTALIRLAIPIILGNLLRTGYQLTDAFWVGRLGAAAVAAVSVSFPVTFLVIALGSGLKVAEETIAEDGIRQGRPISLESWRRRPQVLL
jgi:hypothetical protein